MSGGSTLFTPEEDLGPESRSHYRDQLAMTLGGRVAEEIAFGEITTGASDDISRVTRAARAMVTRYGMSERLGPSMFWHQSEMGFLGRAISEQRDYTEAWAQGID